VIGLTRSVRRWFLLDGDRNAVAGIVLAAVFCSIAGLAAVDVIATDRVAVAGIAGSLVPGLFTFISIVLAINQLVLSQEFDSAGEARSRVSDMRSFRRAVERRTDRAPSPVFPTGFLSMLLVAIRTEADALATAVDGRDGRDHARAVRGFGRTVGRGAARADGRLRTDYPGRVNAVLSVLEYDDTRQLQEARRIHEEYEPELPERAERSLAELVELLELFDVARTHFRTVYTQRVLARLSRTLLYVGTPALLIAVLLGLLNPAVPGSPTARLVLIAAALTATFAPLAVLFAYVLRISAVSERTVGVGPFVSRPTAAHRGGGRENASRDPTADDDRQ